MSSKRIRIYLIISIIIVSWGIASPVIKYALSWFSPGIFLTYRFAVSASIAIFIIAISRSINLPKNKNTLKWALIYAFMNSTLQLGLLFLGYDKTSAVDASFISATGPIFISVAGVRFLNEHLTKREKIGISIAFVGTAVTILAPLLNGGGTSGLSGNFLVFLAVLVSTANAVIAKKLLRENLTPITATNLSFIVGFITTLPIMLFIYPIGTITKQISEAPPGFHLAVFYMAIISGSLAYYLWHKVQKSIEIGEVGVFYYLQPVIAAPIAVVWLGEKVTLPFIAGAAIIAIGVGIAEYKRSKRIL